jgi:hypothetical protein
MDRNVTLRRTLEQIVHCCEEALSVEMNDEDLRCAVDDLSQARNLIVDTALPQLEIRVPENNP